MIFKYWVVLIVIISNIHLAIPQEVTGNLEGRVLDSKNATVPGVTIIVTSPSLQGERGVSSDKNGFFRLLLLPSGKYTVNISHVAFHTLTINDVHIRLGKTTAVGDVILQESTVGMPEVVISGERPLIDPNSTTSGLNLTREKFEDLPLDRNYRSLSTILPEASLSYYGDEVNISGATGLENRYFINGNEVTDPDGGKGGINVPYNFIREIELKAGGYEPEYKSSLGGVMNVVTYSGGNDLSGQVFSFFTNNKMQSASRMTESEPSRGDLSQYDIGLTLGGPIIKDKLWFFGAYAPSFRNEDVNLPGLGYYPDEMKTHSFAGKLTWKTSRTIDVSASIVGDPTIRNDVGNSISGWSLLSLKNSDPALSKITSGGYAMFLDVSHIPSNNLAFQLGLSLTTRGEKWNPAEGGNTTDITYYDAPSGTMSGGYPYIQETAVMIPDIKLSVMSIIDQHLLKAGIEYREVHEDLSWSGTDLTRYSDTSYQIQNYFGDGTVKHRFPSLFLQDSWNISKAWRITGGLRWDGVLAYASNGKLVSRILGQYQPRLGVVFMPGGDESRKISASFGRYAEDLLMWSTTFYYNAGVQFSRIHYIHDPRIDPSGADTLVSYESSIPSGITNLTGQYYDEYSLGYEQLLSDDFKITIRGIFRQLKEVIEDAEYPIGTGEFYLGNPGSDPLSDYPHPMRENLSMQILIEKSLSSRLNLLCSYVLSRNYGNFTGFFNQEGQGVTPNMSRAYDYLDVLINATGLLPNDRTHVFKVNSTYRFDFGLTFGASFTWMSGTPLSEYGRNIYGLPVHIIKRGTAGRLPSLWDLNLRFTYGFPIELFRQMRPRLILDIYHVASQREVVRQGELHYLEIDADGNYFNPDPSYGKPLNFQPPMSVRIGIEINF
jgi:hypothetical protein